MKIEEIEAWLAKKEDAFAIYQGTPVSHKIIRSLIAQVKEAEDNAIAMKACAMYQEQKAKEARKQAFEEAFEAVEDWTRVATTSQRYLLEEIIKALRRKAEQEIGNSGRVDDNPDDISG